MTNGKIEFGSQHSVALRKPTRFETTLVHSDGRSEQLRPTAAARPPKPLPERWSPEFDSELDRIERYDFTVAVGVVLGIFTLEEAWARTGGTPPEYLPTPSSGPVAPKVVFSASFFDRMQRVVGSVPVEASWYGLVELRPDGVYYVDEFHLPFQDCTGVATRSPLNGWTRELLKAGRREDTTRIRFWGHSHVDFAPIPSDQDEAQVERNGTKIAGRTNPFYIRAIANKHGALVVDLFDFEAKTSFRNIPWDVQGGVQPPASVEDRVLSDLIRERLEIVDELDRDSTFERQRRPQETATPPAPAPTERTGVSAERSAKGEVPRKRGREAAPGKSRTIAVTVLALAVLATLALGAR